MSLDHPRITPGQGELLTSVVQRRASLDGVDPQEWTRIVVRTSDDQAQVRSGTEPWMFPTAPEVGVLATALGVTTGQVEAASLIDWLGSVLSDGGQNQRRMLGLRVRASAYCPECLATTGWDRKWVLPLVTDCVRHAKVLLVGCPSCQARTNPLDTRRYGTHVHCRCGTDLTQQRAPHASGPPLQSQRRLQTYVETRRDHEGRNVRSMIDRLFGLVPLMTRALTIEDVPDDPAWIDTYGFDRPPSQRQRRVGSTPGFAANICSVDDDPERVRHLVHHALLLVRGDPGSLERIGDTVEEITVGGKPVKMNNPAAQVLRPGLARDGLSFLVTAARELGPVDPAAIPSSIPYWETDPRLCAPRYRNARGPAAACLFLMANSDRRFEEAREYLALAPGPGSYKHLSTRDLRTAHAWLHSELPSDFPSRRAHLQSLPAGMVEGEWVRRTGLAGDPHLCELTTMILYWSLVLLAPPRHHPAFATLTHSQQCNLRDRYRKWNTPEVRHRIHAFLASAIDTHVMEAS